jgi:hypothetical protein
MSIPKCDCGKPITLCDRLNCSASTLINTTPMSNNNTQLPGEVTEEIIYQAEEKAEAFFKNLQAEFPEGDFSNQIAQQIGFRKGHRASATEYATKLLQAEKEVKRLTNWKNEAIAVLGPIWDYAEQNINVPLGKSKTEAVITELERLRVENDKLNAMATGWRPLLEKVIHRHEGGLLPDRILYLEIKTFLYGE